ncbi:unnamed protein product [Arabidopsis thaliana]|uniref:Zinc knuckle CX2CX4HX4C domain-containing protein n=1 Tax=Arabidopsis thaliana TaxID=3702 RepID=A0A5S9WMD3_ARATH|nr:unnamed protein product [Arabidopsis thaliana]
MSDELWNDIQHMELGRELFIPYHAYAGAFASNRLSHLGRILNPQTQSIERAILEIPYQWGLERTIEFIASTLGEVVAMDFNEETTTQITFIRVKVRIDFIEPLRFFRRVRFESREGAMNGFKYEKLQQVCTNCCRVNHQVSHCPYLVHHEDLDDESEVMVIPERHDGEGSNSLNRWDQEINSQNSNISTYSPLHDFPVLSWNFYTAGNLPHRFSSSSNSSTPIASGWRPTTRPTYEFGESSKRKKGKQVWEDPERNIRQRRMELGIRFYLVDGETP